MKGNVSYLMIVTPIIFSIMYFGGLDMFLGDNILAKGLLLTLLADAFCIFALLAYNSMKRKLSSLQVGRVLSIQKWMLSITIFSLVLSVILLYPNSHSMISAGVFVISLTSFLSFILLLKGLGGRVEKNTMLHSDCSYIDSHSSHDLINPANGLPMIDGISGVDVQGNSWGTNGSESSNSYDASRGY